MLSRISFFLCCLLAVASCADSVIFDGKSGKFNSNWQNWSYSSTIVPVKTPVKTGYTYSLAITAGNYNALYMHYAPQGGFKLSSYSALSFWAYGVDANDHFTAIIFGANTWYKIGLEVDLSSYIKAGKWTKIKLTWDLFQLDSTDVGNGFQIQYSDNGVGKVILTDIRLLDINAASSSSSEDSSSSSSVESSSSEGAASTAVKITLTSEISASTISPYIFGANWASDAQLKANNYTVNRWGGNHVSRYAWDVDADNRAKDYFFENIPSTIADDSQLPFGSSADTFMSTTLARSATPLVTIPMLGYVPFDRAVRCGYSVSLYGDQKSVDPHNSDCGNGVLYDDTYVYNNPYDISKSVDEQYAIEWLQHIDQSIGSDQVKFFALDNEPGLWHITHRDVHPDGVTYEELWAKTVAYAGAIKQYYPNSKIFGPVTWGYCEVFFSPADGNCKRGADRILHDDMPMLQWYIKQVGDYKKKNGVQLVDVIDVHLYPSGSKVNTNAEDTATVAERFKETRAFWDPTYVDDYYAAKINLIPNIQSWINTYCPGLKISVSEYSYGGDNIITGALAQVMLLGIFARQNVYLASRWEAPQLGTFTELAFQLYTNYDGKGSKVAGNPITTKSSDASSAEVYAFKDSKTIYVVAVNKRADATSVSIDFSAVSGFTVATDLTYTGFYFDSASNGIARFTNIDATTKTVTMKARSAVLIKVVSKNSAASVTVTTAPTTSASTSSATNTTKTDSLKSSSTALFPSFMMYVLAFSLVIFQFVL